MRGLILIFCALFLGNSSSAQTWVSTSLVPNYEVMDMKVHKGKLYIAGYFYEFNGKIANRVVRWNGDTIETLAAGVWGGPNPWVNKIIPWGDSLVVVGNFTHADSILSNDVAIWYNDQWIGVNDKEVQVADISDAAIYKGELYVGGVFDSINNIRCSHIAKWDGSQWSQVGQGLIGRSVNDLQVYKGDLYATGSFDSVATGPAPYIARWDGQQWHALGNSENIGGSGLGIWNDKLLISERFSYPRPGVYFSSIYTWDGQNFEEMFRRDGFITMTSFYAFNDELFAVELSGHNLDSNYSLVYVWNEAREEFLQYGRGINRDPTCMAEFQGEIYVGGLFHTNNGAVADFIAKLELPPVGEKELEEKASFGVRVYPNPTKDKLNIRVKSNTEDVYIELKDIQGRSLQGSRKMTKAEKHTWKHELDLSAQVSGIYFITVKSDEAVLTKKVILNK